MGYFRVQKVIASVVGSDRGIGGCRTMSFGNGTGMQRKGVIWHDGNPVTSQLGSDWTMQQPRGCPVNINEGEQNEPSRAQSVGLSRT
jgi:hypothetical protein